MDFNRLWTRGFGQSEPVPFAPANVLDTLTGLPYLTPESAP